MSERLEYSRNGVAPETVQSEVDGFCMDCGYPLVQVIGPSPTGPAEQLGYRKIGDNGLVRFFRCPGCHAEIDCTFIRIKDTGWSRFARTLFRTAGESIGLLLRQRIRLVAKILVNDREGSDAVSRRLTRRPPGIIR